MLGHIDVAARFHNVAVKICTQRVSNGSSTPEQHAWVVHMAHDPLDCRLNLLVTRIQCADSSIATEAHFHDVANLPFVHRGLRRFCQQGINDCAQLTATYSSVQEPTQEVRARRAASHCRDMPPSSFPWAHPIQRLNSIKRLRRHTQEQVKRTKFAGVRLTQYRNHKCVREASEPRHTETAHSVNTQQRLSRTSRRRWSACRQDSQTSHSIFPKTDQCTPRTEQQESLSCLKYNGSIQSKKTGTHTVSERNSLAARDRGIHGNRDSEIGADVLRITNGCTMKITSSKNTNYIVSKHTQLHSKHCSFCSISKEKI